MRDERQILDLCNHVRETAFALHNYLRHGHLEKVYENGLAHRLRGNGLEVEQQKALHVFDEDGTPLGNYIADLPVEDCLLVEVKACETLGAAHTAQVLGYLRAASRRDALLINFGAPRFQIRKLVL